MAAETEHPAAGPESTRRTYGRVRKLVGRMKGMILIMIAVVSGLLAAGPPFVVAQEKAETPETRETAEMPGFRDEDGDGVNDLFRDADGDGVNDLTGTRYRHTFRYVDEDGDGRNDLFRDADGDGRNDIFRDENGDGIRDSQAMGPRGMPFRDLQEVLDFDGDGRNDVTGSPISRNSRGRGFVDEDGDGFNDKARPADRADEKGPDMESADRFDTFRDEDGDGINDGRGLGRDMRNRGRGVKGRFSRGGKDK